MADKWDQYTQAPAAGDKWDKYAAGKVDVDALMQQMAGPIPRAQLAQSMKAALGYTPTTTSPLEAAKQEEARANTAAQEASQRLHGVTGAILPGLGMMAGGAIGGPVGAGIGGMVGGLGNELASSFIPGASGYLGPAAANPQQLSDRLFQEGVTSAVGEGLAKGVGALLKVGGPASEQVFNQFNRTGVTPTAGDVGGSLTRGFQDLMSRTFLGSGPIEKARDKQVGEIIASRGRLLDALGPDTTAKGYGQKLQTALDSNYKALYGDPASGIPGNFDRAYQEVGKMVEGAVPPPASIARIGTAAQKALTELDKKSAVLEIQQPGITKTIRDLIYQTSALAPQEGQQIAAGTGKTGVSGTTLMVPGDLPKVGSFEELKGMHDTLADLLRSMPSNGPASAPKRYLSMIKGAVDQALQDTADQAGPMPGKYWADLQKAYGDAADIYRSPESAVADVRNMREPEFAFQTIFKKGAATEPENLEKAITGQVFSDQGAAARLGLTQGLSPTQQAKEATSRRLIQGLFDDASAYMKGHDAGEIKTYGSRILDSLSSVPKEVQDKYFTSEQLKGIKDLAEVASRVEQEVGQGPGHGALIQLHQAGMVLGGQAFGAPKAAASVLIAPPILSRMFVNPTVTKFLAKGFELQPGTIAAAQWLTRAATLAKLYQEHETVPWRVVQRFVTPDKSELH